MAADVNDSIDQQAVVSLSPGGRVTTEEELSPVELAVPLQGPASIAYTHQSNWFGDTTTLETPPCPPCLESWRHSFLISILTDRI